VEQEKFIILPEKYIFDYKLTGNQIKVLCFFIKYNQMYKELFFSVDYISKHLNLSKRTISKILQKFKKWKFLNWVKRTNNSNLYTLYVQKPSKWSKEGQTPSKNYSLINTYNKNNNEKVEGKKYVNINIIQNNISKITKNTNIFYKAKVNENKKLSPRQLLEKKAWQLIGEMDKYKREMLIEGFESDKNKWEDFLERIKYHKFIFYKGYKRR
jgi:predicted transcriptional regulator|tara:strand:- start:83 stop:718 length:636 start_codon:yes stop_codon:yes gene_type:complete